MYQLAVYCRNKAWHHQAYLFAKAGADIAYPTDVLFVEKDICEWRIFDELAIAAYWTGHYVESKKLCEKLLAMPLAADDAERVRENLQFALEKLTVFKV